MRVAVIPARGGSKRIPRKNIKLFRGLPMISYSIAAAKKCGLFDQIIVSTDDEEVAQVARAHGAEVPFIRPENLSDDFIGTTAVVAHATQWVIDAGVPSLEAVCCIYATAPFLQADDLARGLELLEAGPWRYSFSVTDFSAPIFRAFRQNAEGGVEMFFPENFAVRSQDLPRALHDAAQFYWGRQSAWLAQDQIFEAHSCPVPIPRWRVQDIDSHEDWLRAEYLYAAIELAGRRGA